MAADIFIRVVSKHGKVTMLLDETAYSATWWKTVELALFSLKRYERKRKKVNYKVLEHHRFSTKRHLMVMNARNRTLKMHICLFAASETVTSRNLLCYTVCNVKFKQGSRCALQLTERSLNIENKFILR
ncbi:hypothetical protein AVEN_35020-1 [Araneus ventricosus]|uniref:Uncharacterized protein n=1 Tax=Araneus ventricosus TaxID=182803 RepID=A0A4Y2HZU2_ARAVE|nr:hypothetical protein AVEN_35020-1 [Araneus ventricosus]